MFFESKSCLSILPFHKSFTLNQFPHQYHPSVVPSGVSTFCFVIFTISSCTFLGSSGIATERVCGIHCKAHINQLGGRC
jgi:hypothetical protein